MIVHIETVTVIVVLPHPSRNEFPVVFRTTCDAFVLRDEGAAHLKNVLDIISYESKVLGIATYYPRRSQSTSHYQRSAPGIVATLPGFETDKLLAPAWARAAL